MPTYTRKLPTFALYAAYADEFGLTVFGSCRDEALNNLADELAARQVPAGESGLATKGRGDAGRPPV